MKTAYEPEDIELSRYEIIFSVSGDFHAEIGKNVGGAVWILLFRKSSTQEK